MTVTDFDTARDAARFDLSIYLRLPVDEDGKPGPILADIGFATDLFDASTVRALFGRVVRVLEAAVVDADRRLAELDLLGDDERRLLLDRGTGPAVPDREQRPVPEVIRAQAQRTPAAPAVRCGDRTLTYAELDAAADRLARRLVAAGAGPGRAVTTVLPQSVDLPVALLAVLRTGSHYVPLTGSARRRSEIHDRSGADILLTHGEVTHGEVAACGRPHADWVVLVDDTSDVPGELGPVSTLDDLACVLYPADRPDGLALTHRELGSGAAAVAWSCVDPERFLLVSADESDLAGASCWAALVAGGTAVIAPDADHTVDRIAEVVEDEEITGLVISPGLFAMVAADYPECLTEVRGIAVTGAVPPPGDAVRRVLAAGAAMVRTVHRPTGSAAGATAASWRSAAAVPATLPAGTPLPGTTVSVLDDALDLAAPGVIGELYTGNRRTGQRARWTPAGVIDLVEPAFDVAEVEAVLLRASGIRDAAVVAHGTRVIGYVVADGEIDGDIDNALDGLAAHLRDRLPEHLRPHVIVPLDAIARTGDGLPDRQALPVPEDESETSTVDDEPTSDEERLLCGLFAQLLAVDPVGVHDDFFELGGHSLLATQLVSAIRGAADRELSVRTVFEAPHPRALAERLRAAHAGRVALAAGARPASSRCPSPSSGCGSSTSWKARARRTTCRSSTGSAGRTGRRRTALCAAGRDRRHEILRTVLREVAGHPVQVLLPAGPVPVHSARCTEPNWRR